MGMDKSELSFSHEWVAEMKSKLQRAYPSMSSKDID